MHKKTLIIESICTSRGTRTTSRTKLTQWNLTYLIVNGLLIKTQKLYSKKDAKISYNESWCNQRVVGRVWKRKCPYGHLCEKYEGL